MQMVASLRRLDYTALIRERAIDPRRCDPNDPMFDPSERPFSPLGRAMWMKRFGSSFWLRILVSTPIRLASGS